MPRGLGQGVSRQKLLVSLAKIDYDNDNFILPANDGRSIPSMAQRRGRIVLAIALILLALSAWRTAFLQRDQQRLGRAYEQAQQTIVSLQGERTRLSDELGKTKQTMDEQTGNIASLEKDLDLAKGQLEKTLAELTDLQKEQAQLRKTANSIQERLAGVEAEKQQLEVKLSSIKELKLAIREVRRKIWQQRWAAWRARLQTARESDQQVLASDNRGYIIRQGISTLGTKTRLQVRVLDVQSE